MRYVARESFMAFLANKFHSLNQQLLAEVFQESVSRVWENIERRKLTETSLTSSLSTYLNSTGIRVWLENNRRYECVNIPSIPTLTIGLDLLCWTDDIVQ